MATYHQLPGEFLNDLDSICASAVGRRLPPHFLHDLDVAHTALAASEPRITAAELAKLATTLDALRGRYREELRGLLEGLLEYAVRCARRGGALNRQWRLK